VYSQLYPPLRATLLCLSKLYRAVDAQIFSGLAQEAVSACTVSVQQASTMVARKVRMCKYVRLCVWLVGCEWM
jgi:hypothetical protein